MDLNVKWWNLTSEYVAKVSENIRVEGNWNLVRDADTMWKEMTECI